MKFIRPSNSTEADYSAIVDLYDTIWPDEKHFSVELWRQEDEEWPAGSLNQRFVAEVDGVIAGIGRCYERRKRLLPATKKTIQSSP